MTVPPGKLVAKLEQLDHDAVLVVRSQDRKRVAERVTVLQAMSLAICGEIEGVCKPSGKLRYLVYLKPEAKPDPDLFDVVVRKDETYESHSTVIAHTGLGVYREPIVDALDIEERHGLASQPLTGGFVWAHCALRGQGL